MSIDERQKLWKDEDVGQMRERMKERILQESAMWKKQRAEKEKEADKKGDDGESVSKEKAAEESDDDIIVQSVSNLKTPRRKSGKATTAAPKTETQLIQQKAARIRG